MNVDNIKINTQSSIRLELDKVLYFDPFKIEQSSHDADIIFITHSHYDHFDINSINNIKKDNTIIVVPKSMENELKNINIKDIIYMNPNEETNIEDINVKTIPSYNKLKPFHPKRNNWLGYIVTYNNISYYVSGDTDKTEDNEKVQCDVALVPIGGHYTMDAKEASELLKIINPKVVIPTHYGSIIGNIEDAKILKDNLSDTDIDVIEKIMNKLSDN